MNAPLNLLHQQSRYNYGLRLIHPLAGYSHLLDPLTIASLSLQSKNQQFHNGYYNSFVSGAQFQTEGFCSQRFGASLSPKSNPPSDGDTSHGSLQPGMQSHLSSHRYHGAASSSVLKGI